MTKKEEQLVIEYIITYDRLRALESKARSQGGILFGEDGPLLVHLRNKCSTEGSRLASYDRRSQDEKLHAIVDHLVRGRSLTRSAARHAYSRGGLKQIIRRYRIKSRKV